MAIEGKIHQPNTEGAGKIVLEACKRLFDAVMGGASEEQIRERGEVVLAARRYGDMCREADKARYVN
jgi:hypothetical protein